MKIGLVGYANNQGLGIMNQEFVKKLGIEHQLVIPSSDKGTNLELAAKNHWLCENYCPTDQEIRKFCEKVDVVFAVEATYSDKLFEIAKSMDKRTVFFPMWEWLRNQEEKYKYVDLFICTSRKCYNEVFWKNKVFLPWLLDLADFPQRHIKGPAKKFLHLAGFGGLNWRKGTNETVQAFTSIQGDDLELIIRTQLPAKEFPCYHLMSSDKRITVLEGEVSTKGELYSEGDVLVAPHKYDGQYLVGEEGIASGLPVISTDAPPMNEFGNFFVRVDKFKEVGLIHEHAKSAVINIYDLITKMVKCTQFDLMPISEFNRDNFDLTWKNHGEKYLRALRGD